MNQENIQDRFRYVKALVGPVFVLLMFVAALWFLHLELRKYKLEDFASGFRQIPLAHLLLAIFLTLLNYGIKIFYDCLGIWYIRHPMKFGRIALASFLGYAVGNNFGLLFGGSSIRYRLYSTWGLSAGEIVTLLFVLFVTFWIGLFALAGVVLLIHPLPIPDVLPLPFETTVPLGICLTTVAVIYLLLSGIGKPIRLGKKSFSPPPLPLSLMQYVVASIDLLVAAGIVYVLLPASVETSYYHFVAIFLLAQVAVFLTQVPGGLGVLELSLITLLAPPDKGEVIGALLAYRLIFYLTPMMIGVSLLGVHEVVAQRKNLWRAFETMGKWTPDIAPRFAAVVVFMAGVTMLLAAALPVPVDRIQKLNVIFPAWVIEFHYFFASIFGVVLMLLSRGLYRRIRAAHTLTLPVLAVAIWFALCGSLGYFQALFLVVAFMVVAPVRHYFYRRGRLFSDRIAWHWILTIAAMLLITFWLYWFSYKERTDLWSLTAESDSARSFRSIVGASLLGLVVFLVRVLHIRVGRPDSATHRELVVASEIAQRSIDPNAWLGVLGDKQLIFNEQETAMIAYATYGNSCVALGNPVGPTDDAVQLGWDFRDLCSEQGNWPVFFLVDDRYASLYQEMNLRLLHIGDEAIVDLRGLVPDSPLANTVARIREKADKQSLRMELVSGSEIEAILPDLERIDAAWSRDRAARPNRFSSTYFNADFIRRAEVAVVSDDQRLLGFALVWRGADGAEMTLDMIRYYPTSPAETMHFLIAELMVLAGEQKYKSFNMGAAPLTKEHAEEHARIWGQLMSLTFRFSRHFYSYQGLRNYKDRYHPDWRPVYLAYAADRPVDIILNDISGLIEG